MRQRRVVDTTLKSAARQQYFLGTSMDMGKLKQVEHDLREPEEKYHALFENMAQGAMYIMADGRLDDVNPAALEIFGLSYAEFVEHAALCGPGLKVIHEDGSNLSNDEWPPTLALTSGAPVRNATLGVYNPQQQDYVWVVITAIPQFKPGETQAHRVLTTFHDVTALKQIKQELQRYQGHLEKLVEERTLELQHDIEALEQSEQSLRESEEKYRLIAENARDVIWFENDAHQLTYISPSIQQLLGYTPEEVIEGISGPYLTPESERIIADLFAQKLDKEPGPRRFELEQIRKDGSTVWVEVIIERLYDVMGQHACFLGISRDISTRKQTEADLHEAKEMAESANRAKSMFLSCMSHELRTPLNAILGFAQLLTRETTLSPMQKDYLNTIDRSGEHLLQLINDVLDMSKIEAGHTACHPSSFDLWQMLANVEAMIRGRAEQKGLDFSVEYSTETPRYIMSDEKKLRQILINLLGNAVKYTEQGCVTLRVIHSEAEIFGLEEAQSKISHLTFDISDTGPGIAPRELSTIFEAFRQLSHVKKHEGSGLGLSISRKFAQLLGGDIQVTSEPGRGSQFSAHIQVETANPDDVDSGEHLPDVIGLASLEFPKRILVVDDHAESRHLIAMLLGNIGFELNKAANGREALALLEKWTPDLILMDIRMPVMDGYEATQKVREQETANRQPPMPIIAMTASVFEEEQQQVLAAGCNMLLRKPVSAPELFEAIRSHLEVEYIYAPGERLPETQRGKNTKHALTPEALGVLPGALLDTLKHAMISGKQAVMMQAVESVRGQNAELADSMTPLVQHFKYQALWKMLQQIAPPTGADK